MDGFQHQPHNPVAGGFESVTTTSPVATTQGVGPPIGANTESSEQDVMNLPPVMNTANSEAAGDEEAQLYNLQSTTGQVVPPPSFPRQPDAVTSTDDSISGPHGTTRMEPLVDDSGLPSDGRNLPHEVGGGGSNEPMVHHQEDRLELPANNVASSSGGLLSDHSAMLDEEDASDLPHHQDGLPGDEAILGQDDRIELPQAKVDEMMAILKEHEQEYPDDDVDDGASNAHHSAMMTDDSNMSQIHHQSVPTITESNTSHQAQQLQATQENTLPSNQPSTVIEENTAQVELSPEPQEGNTLSSNQQVTTEDNVSQANRSAMIEDSSSQANQSSLIDRQAIPATNVQVDVSTGGGDWCSFKCKFCPKSFQDRKAWKYHNMDEHGLLPYGCRYCDERYERKHDLKEHEHYHKSMRSKSRKHIIQHVAAQPVGESTTPPVSETPMSGIPETATDEHKATPTVVNTENNPSPNNSENQTESNEELVTREPLAVTRRTKKQAKTTLQAAVRKAGSPRGRKKSRHKTKSDLIKTLKHSTSQQHRKKKNVVVVSVLDVIASDAKLAKQGMKPPSGGASGALLNIVDKIRNDHPEHFEKMKGKYHLRAIRKKGLFDDTEELPLDDVVDDDDETEATYTPRSPRSKRVKSKSYKRVSTKGRKLYSCRICPRMLSSNKVKIYHERGHPYPHECKFCHRVFQNKRDLGDHEMGHVTGTWTCRNCQDVFDEYESLETHQKMHLQDHKDNLEFPCQYCSKKMKSKKSLEVHTRIHTNERPYQCQFCDKSYRHYESWNYHESKHKGTLKQHVCQFCGKAFGGKYGLQVHERIHTGEKPYKCDHCNLAFSSNEKLKVHKDRVNGLAFVCQFCGKNFFTKANLNQHEMIHKGVKPHQCKTCEASFVSITSLKYHNRTVHTGERYPCQICNKPCKSKGQLTSHLRSHTDERPFKCKFCNKSFRNSNTLKTHEQGIHLGLRYTCPVCKKDFSQRTALRTHDKLVHQGIKWKDMVMQRKINREQRLMHHDNTGKLVGHVDVKFSPGAAPPSSALPPTAPTRTDADTAKLAPARRDLVDLDMMEEQASESVKAQMQALKFYQQHRMVMPPLPAPSATHAVMSEEEQQSHQHHQQPACPSSSEHDSGMEARLTPKQVQQSFGGLQGPIPVSISGCDQSSVDVAYQLATLATSARHLMHIRHTQQGHHHGDEGLQVHVPGHHVHHPGVHVPHSVQQGDPSGVVDVVFPPDNGPPMYQTL